VLLVADFLRLHGERWLNGELMNSVIVMINDKQQRLHAANRLLDVEVLDVEELDAEAPANLRSCMFGTYFYLRLVPVAGAYDYDGVRRWGAGVRLDLSAVDVILVPINVDGSHWVLVQVNVQDQYFLFYDPYGTKDNHGYVNAVRRWLIYELRAMLGQAAVSEWAVDNWESLEDADLPRQTDSGSCGNFVQIVAYYLSLGKALTFTQDDIDVLRHRLAIALYLDELDTSAPAAVVDRVNGAERPPATDGVL